MFVVTQFANPGDSAGKSLVNPDSAQCETPGQKMPESFPSSVLHIMWHKQYVASSSQNLPVFYFECKCL